MCTVSSIVDQDVAELVDDAYIESQITADVHLVFACVEPNDEPEITDTTPDGKPVYLITLPYEQVKGKQKAEVRKLMLQKANERLRQTA